MIRIASNGTGDKRILKVLEAKDQTKEALNNALKASMTVNDNNR